MPQESVKATTFRLGEDTIADLARIAEHLTALTGREHNRTDAVRWAARQAADALRKKSEKSTQTY
jgi:hypothetical protein